MNIQEVHEQRNRLYEQLKQVAAGKQDAETRAKFDAMNSELTELDGDLARLQSLEKFEAEQRSAQRPPRNQPGADVNEDPSPELRAKKEKRALEQFIRFGSGGVDAEHRSFLQGAEQRNVTTGSSGANGAALVPQAFYPVLTEAQKFWGPIATKVRNIQTPTGAPMKISLVNDTGNGLTLLGEATNATELDPVFNPLTLNSDTMTTGMVTVTIQELEDSYFDLDSWLRGAFGKRYGRGIEQVITNGNGSSVASLLSVATTGVTAAGNGTAAGGTSSATGADGSNSIAYDDLTALEGVLDPAYQIGSSFVMNAKTLSYLKGVTNTFGQPLYMPSPNAGGLDTILGHPIVLNQSMPNMGASSTPILLGDLEAAYLYRRVDDLTILRFDQLFLQSLQIGFMGYCRIGGIGLNAGISPLVGLKMAAS